MKATTMTAREARIAATNGNGNIHLDTDTLREGINGLLDKASKIELAPSDKAAKTRITKIEKEMKAFEVGFDNLEARVKANGSIFPLVEGIRDDFTTLTSMVNREKDFYNPTEDVTTEDLTQDDIDATVDEFKTRLAKILSRTA